MLVLMAVSGVYAVISVVAIVIFCRIAALAEGRPPTAAQRQPAPVHVRPVSAARGIVSHAESFTS
jgi:hypothetical protein